MQIKHNRKICPFLFTHSLSSYKLIAMTQVTMIGQKVLPVSECTILQEQTGKYIVDYAFHLDDQCHHCCHCFRYRHRYWVHC